MKYYLYIEFQVIVLALLEKMSYIFNANMKEVFENFDRAKEGKQYMQHQFVQNYKRCNWNRKEWSIYKQQYGKCQDESSIIPWENYSGHIPWVKKQIQKQRWYIEYSSRATNDTDWSQAEGFANTCSRNLIHRLNLQVLCYF